MAALDSKDQRIPSLAVLPLENLSRDPEQEYPVVSNSSLIAVRTSVDIKPKPPMTVCLYVCSTHIEVLPISNLQRMAV